MKGKKDPIAESFQERIDWAQETDYSYTQPVKDRVMHMAVKEIGTDAPMF